MTPINPVLTALAAGAGFVARGFVGNQEHLVSLMKQAIEYKGYALLDILQPCVSFNKVNTYKYYSEHVYELDDSYDTKNKAAAMEKAMEFGDRIPIGVLYNVAMPTYHSKHPLLKHGTALIDSKPDKSTVNKLIEEFI